MTYLPNPTVTIDGRNYTGDTIGQISVRRGRDTVYAQVQSGVASIELIDVDGIVIPTVGQEVRVTLDDSTGSPVRVFTGNISDWSSTVRAVQGGTLVAYRLQALGPIAKLNRRSVLFAGRPVESDGDRVLAAIEAGLAAAWEEQPLDLAWEDVDAEKTWAEFDDGFDPALIDPGIFDVAALDPSDGGYAALSVAGDAATSGTGALFETADGLIGYEDADRRLATADGDFTPIPFGDITVDGLSIAQDLADITNRVVVEFDGGAVERTDAASLVEFGLLATRINTILVNQQNAEDYADLFLERHAAPIENIGRVSVNLRGADGPLIDLMLAANTGTPVVLTGLPQRPGLGGQYSGFIEGIDITVSDFAAEVGFLLSSEALSTGPVRWSVLPQTLTWESINPTLTWQDARSI